MPLTSAFASPPEEKGPWTLVHFYRDRVVFPGRATRPYNSIDTIRQCSRLRLYFGDLEIWDQETLSEGKSAFWEGGMSGRSPTAS